MRGGCGLATFRYTAEFDRTATTLLASEGRAVNHAQLLSDQSISATPKPPELPVNTPQTVPGFLGYGASLI